MATLVALIRAVNVGGTGKLPMKDLVFIHFPEGQGPSKLAFGRSFGLHTARNMNTVTRLAGMARGS
jgi:uncharacterized protein (DUF1697 family)